jgi:tetratricopeptide (TPR) repeat protein
MMPKPNRDRPRSRGSSTRPASHRPPISRSRLWAFRFLAAVLVPLLFLALLELGLRLAGWGHSSRFFLKSQVQGRDVFVENDQFGLRFFSAELARSPSPLVMPASKPPGSCRIFIFGESAALGDPEPAFGFGRCLQVLLAERYPGTPFEVVCTAMTAINSHAILPIARECAHHQGDIWVLYMGNNEFVGPFGAATVFGPQVPPLALIRLNLALKSTRLGQLLGGLISRRPKQGSWGGMKMFLENQVGPDDPRKERVYGYFRQNLEDILRLARKSGARVVISTVAGNLKDCPPFASRHSSTLSAPRLQDWELAYMRGTNAEAGGDSAQALTNYVVAARLDPGFAELQYRAARCCLALSNVVEARRYFESARDFDALPFRADSRLNQIIEDTAARFAGPGLRLAGAAALLAQKSPGGIIGGEFLFEHVHLNFEGNYLVAQTVADKVAKLLPDTMTRGAKPEWAGPELCARRLALTDWDRQRVLENVLQRLAEPPFINQLDHHRQVRALRETLAAIGKRLTDEAAQQARALYQEAITAAPGDFYLLADSARLLEDTGDVEGAIRQWQQVRELIPFAPAAYYYSGKLLARQGKSEEALQALDRALELRPDLADALDEKGQLLLKQKKAGDALALFEKAASLRPENARLCLHRADALAMLNRRPEAFVQLLEAVRLQPGYSEAHYLLGVELALNGAVREAAAEFLEVTRLNPNYPLGHLNLGIALAKLGRTDDATMQFRETLRLDPDNRKALDYLGAIERPQKKAR